MSEVFNIIFPDDSFDFIEKKTRPDRREEMLSKKGLLDDPIYRIRSSKELDSLFPIYPSSNKSCNINHNNDLCNCNYKMCFDFNDSEGYKNALNKYGMCIIKVFDDKTCNDTIIDMFNEINNSAIQLKGSQECKIDITHPASWDKRNWPSKGKFLVRDPAFSQKAFDNRTNPIIYNIFKDIFERDDLNCSIDNWGLFRGTKDLIFTKEEYQKWWDRRMIGRQQFEKYYRKENDGKDPPPDDISKYNIRIKKDDKGNEIVLLDRPDWRHNLKPHWDLNPWKWLKECNKGEPQQYQALVALCDCPEPVGGFACLPGSHIFVKDWCNEHRQPHNKRITTRVPEDDFIIDRIQRIPLRKGEMVIWNSALIHCNFPNYSDKMRLIQFIRMLPAISVCENKDRYCAKRILHHYPQIHEKIENNEINISELGLKLLGLQ